MNAQIAIALKKKEPNEFIYALADSFPYRRPADFAKLSAEGKLVICCHCFALEMFSGGYRQVISNLPEWSEEIVRSLRAIRAVPYAETFAGVVQKAKAEGLALSDQTDWCDFCERHHDFREDTVRDYKTVVEVVARGLREYIVQHESAF